MRKILFLKNDVVIYSNNYFNFFICFSDTLVGSSSFRFLYGQNYKIFHSVTLKKKKNGFLSVLRLKTWSKAMFVHVADYL